MANRSEPKIIIFDLETIPNLKEVMKVMPGLSAYPGLTLKASINTIICFGYRVFGEDDKAKCINAWDFKGWRKDVNDDYELIKRAREILVDADAIVTHNGKRFDLKFLNTRLMIHGLDPLPKINHVDTCAKAKANLFLFNNRLDTLGKFLVNDKKLENGGWELWTKVLERDAKSMKLMEQYCKQDVDLTAKVFKKLRPFCNEIPNYNLWASGERMLCSHCGSTRIQKMGFITTKTALRQRYRCEDCRSTMSVKADCKLPRSI
jgi:DNA polymerase elongation subunit (family B)